VGIGTALRIWHDRPVSDPTQVMPAIVSPWQTGQLSSIVWNDILAGSDTFAVMRAEAIALPAVSRARDILTATIARCPLVTFRGPDELVDPGPAWTYRTDGAVSPYHRMLWTIDDLLFHGWSLWAKAADTDGHLLDAERIPPDSWEIDADGRILVLARPVDPADVVLIPGPHEGILSRNARAIRAAAALDRAYLSSARNPTPTVELHQTGGVPLEKDEVGDLVSDWRTARTGDGGSTAYTPESIELRTHGGPAEALLVDGRNSAAVDMARICDVPASLVDATNAGASLTYETTAGRNLEFLDYGVELYMGPVEARLSLDDVVPRGTRVAFDRAPLTSLTTVSTGPPRTD
jgi:hypothetical protein